MSDAGVLPTTVPRDLRGWWTRLLRRVHRAPPAPLPPAYPGAGPRRTPPPQAATGARPDGGAAPRPTITDLYHAHRLDMVRLAVLLVDDLHTAEDVVQDAFMAVYRRHGSSLTDLNDAAAYLHTSVVNAARSVLRRRRTARGYSPPREASAAPSDEQVLLREEHREVLAALRLLTRRQREVLVLRYWSDLSELQIADTLGVSRGSVKSTASRALDALEKRLREAGR
ncbi:sigma-70 family RNA polymerase sigma factor [Allostreptomyces psammosilenae]|uniref:RNA polymerase sigma-70 factor (Sigma-E family) n=1 Tax=Allostreptomyces psammosilenae TaxID=1892865 RepID=A0A852ZU97_9ACTN|nr:sigma-70 family RNA polymerase sigma factor [Allostreptomyces psammosilenae]NYI05966.1 RNA polymerase sigma-70 factor (sigma-E family) [Allostreptomyces psammosilenae]